MFIVDSHIRKLNVGVRKWIKNDFAFVYRLRGYINVLKQYKHSMVSVGGGFPWLKMQSLMRVIYRKMRTKISWEICLWCQVLYLISYFVKFRLKSSASDAISRSRDCKRDSTYIAWVNDFISNVKTTSNSDSWTSQTSLRHIAFKITPLSFWKLNQLLLIF